MLKRKRNVTIIGEWWIRWQAWWKRGGQVGCIIKVEVMLKSRLIMKVWKISV